MDADSGLTSVISFLNAFSTSRPLSSSSPTRRAASFAATAALSWEMASRRRLFSGSCIFALVSVIKRSKAESSTFSDSVMKLGACAGLSVVSSLLDSEATFEIALKRVEGLSPFSATSSAFSGATSSSSSSRSDVRSTSSMNSSSSTPSNRPKS